MKDKNTACHGNVVTFYLTLSVVAIGTRGLFFSFMKQNEIQRSWCRGYDGTEELEMEE